MKNAALLLYLLRTNFTNYQHLLKIRILKINLKYVESELLYYVNEYYTTYDSKRNLSFHFSLSIIIFSVDKIRL